MKLTNLNPKRIFRRKDRSEVSRSDPPSFGSTSSSVSSAANGGRTPNSVLPKVPGDFRGELTQAFRLIDSDNDGFVSLSELEAVLARLAGAAPPDGRDGGGCISVEEIVNRVGSGCGTEELKEAFEVFDKDGDGRIYAEDLLRVFAAIGDERCTLEQCRRMIEGVDSNGDGFLCFQDFSRMMGSS
ncbi:EF-Hand 1, calcium-binding site [Sesbania bispinosa]|nr:EF-Hand 1, calcium-binding site [Sesbania bispinosa]